MAKEHNEPAVSTGSSKLGVTGIKKSNQAFRWWPFGDSRSVGEIGERSDQEVESLVPSSFGEAADSLVIGFGFATLLGTLIHLHSVNNSISGTEVAFLWGAVFLGLFLSSAVIWFRVGRKKENGAVLNPFSRMFALILILVFVVANSVVVIMLSLSRVSDVGINSYYNKNTAVFSDGSTPCIAETLCAPFQANNQVLRVRLAKVSLLWEAEVAQSAGKENEAKELRKAVDVTEQMLTKMLEAQNRGGFQAFSPEDFEGITVPGQLKIDRETLSSSTKENLDPLIVALLPIIQVSPRLSGLFGTTTVSQTITETITKLEGEELPSVVEMVKMFTHSEDPELVKSSLLAILNHKDIDEEILQKFSERLDKAFRKAKEFQRRFAFAIELANQGCSEDRQRQGLAEALKGGFRNKTEKRSFFDNVGERLTDTGKACIEAIPVGG
jgi:hypothetical protein